LSIVIRGSDEDRGQVELSGKFGWTTASDPAAAIKVLPSLMWGGELASSSSGSIWGESVTMVVTQRALLDQRHLMLAGILIRIGSK